MVRRTRAGLVTDTGGLLIHNVPWRPTLENIDLSKNGEHIYANSEGPEESQAEQKAK